MISSWAKLACFETVVADITFIVDSRGKANVLDWQANKLQIPVASPLTGEAAAALEVYGRLVWIRDLVKDLMGKQEMPATIVTDSKSLEQAVRTTTSMKDKRAMVTISTLRRILEAENIKNGVIWCKGSEQLADVMTKPGVRPDRIRSILEQGQLDMLNC